MVLKTRQAEEVHGGDSSQCKYFIFQNRIRAFDTNSMVYPENMKEESVTRFADEGGGGALWTSGLANSHLLDYQKL